MMGKLGESLLKGAKEALEYANNEKSKAKVHRIKVPSEVDVKKIRLTLHLNRKDFAERFGFSVRTLEKWEQGIRHPDGAARAYLVVISRNPKAVESALHLK